MTRRVWLCAVILLLSGCGFQLRHDPEWPEAWQTVRIQTPDPLSQLRLDLEQRLRKRLASDDSPDAVVIECSEEQLQREVLSVDDRARVSEYLLRYAVSFEVRRGDEILLPTQRIVLQRDYRFDELQALGAAQEEALITTELRREMVRRILRQLAASGSEI